MCRHTLLLHKARCSTKESLTLALLHTSAYSQPAPSTRAPAASANQAVKSYGLHLRMARAGVAMTPAQLAWQSHAPLRWDLAEAFLELVFDRRTTLSRTGIIVHFKTAPRVVHCHATWQLRPSKVKQAQTPRGATISLLPQSPLELRRWASKPFMALRDLRLAQV